MFCLNFCTRKTRFYFCMVESKFPESCATSAPFYMMKTWRPLMLKLWVIFGREGLCCHDLVL